MTIKSNVIITLVCILFVFTNSQATNYYISFSSGNDLNTGTNINTPWKTISKVNTFNFVAGDAILFKKGDVWRGQLLPKSGNNTANVYYGAYSTGNLPVILGSLSFNNTSEWINLGNNIWKCNTTFLTDVGNILFNNATTIGSKKWDLSSLEIQNDFWYNLATGEVSIYSTLNPAILYSEIELALRQNIINQQNTSYVTFENISIKYGGAHGFGGGNTRNITISSCEISFIGGGDLNMDGNIRYGNGIEFWGNATNNTVEKCKIWEIYDTGVTNQNHTNTATQENIKYQNNLIWNCGLSSFEYWNRPSTSSTSNIYFENNTCLNAGYGWGIQRPDYSGLHVVLDTNPAQTGNIFIRNNIFYNAQRSIYAFENNINGQLEIDNNLSYQNTATDTLYASFPSFSIYKYSEFPAYTSATGNDLNGFTGNPNFIDELNLNFTLQNNSIAIDNGFNTNINNDFNGNLRPQNNGFDIGAHEFPATLHTNTIEYPNNTQTYPNPTTDSFSITFNSKNKKVSVTILDVSGRKVYTLKNYKSGETITTKQLNNGLYWIVLKVNTKVFKTSKIVINK